MEGDDLWSAAVTGDKDYQPTSEKKTTENVTSNVSYDEQEYGNANRDYCSADRPQFYSSKKSYDEGQYNYGDAQHNQQTNNKRQNFNPLSHQPHNKRQNVHGMTTTQQLASKKYFADRRNQFNLTSLKGNNQKRGDNQSADYQTADYKATKSSQNTSNTANKTMNSSTNYQWNKPSTTGNIQNRQTAQDKIAKDGILLGSSHEDKVLFYNTRANSGTESSKYSGEPDMMEQAWEDYNKYHYVKKDNNKLPFAKANKGYMQEKSSTNTQSNNNQYQQREGDVINKHISQLYNESLNENNNNRKNQENRFETGKPERGGDRFRGREPQNGDRYGGGSERFEEAVRGGWYDGEDSRGDQCNSGEHEADSSYGGGHGEGRGGYGRGYRNADCGYGGTHRDGDNEFGQRHRHGEGGYGGGHGGGDGGRHAGNDGGYFGIHRHERGHGDDDGDYDGECRDSDASYGGGHRDGDIGYGGRHGDRDGEYDGRHGDGVHDGDYHGVCRDGDGGFGGGSRDGDGDYDGGCRDGNGWYDGGYRDGNDGYVDRDREIDLGGRDRGNRFDDREGCYGNREMGRNERFSPERRGRFEESRQNERDYYQHDEGGIYPVKGKSNVEYPIKGNRNVEYPLKGNKNIEYPVKGKKNIGYRDGQWEEESRGIANEEYVQCGDNRSGHPNQHIYPVKSKSRAGDRVRQEQPSTDNTNLGTNLKIQYGRTEPTCNDNLEINTNKQHSRKTDKAAIKQMLIDAGNKSVASYRRSVSGSSSGNINPISLSTTIAGHLLSSITNPNFSGVVNHIRAGVNHAMIANPIMNQVMNQPMMRNPFIINRHIGPLAKTTNNSNKPIFFRAESAATSTKGVTVISTITTTTTTTNSTVNIVTPSSVNPAINPVVNVVNNCSNVIGNRLIPVSKPPANAVIKPMNPAMRMVPPMRVVTPLQYLPPGAVPVARPNMPFIVRYNAPSVIRHPILNTVTIPTSPARPYFVSQPHPQAFPQTNIQFNQGIPPSVAPQEMKKGEIPASSSPKPLMSVSFTADNNRSESKGAGILPDPIESEELKKQRKKLLQNAIKQIDARKPGAEEEKRKLEFKKRKTNVKKQWFDYDCHVLHKKRLRKLVRLKKARNQKNVKEIEELRQSIREINREYVPLLRDRKSKYIAALEAKGEIGLLCEMAVTSLVDRVVQIRRKERRDQERLAAEGETKDDVKEEDLEEEDVEVDSHDVEEKDCQDIIVIDDDHEDIDGENDDDDDDDGGEVEEIKDDIEEMEDVERDDKQTQGNVREMMLASGKTVITIDDDSQDGTNSSLIEKHMEDVKNVTGKEDNR